MFQAKTHDLNWPIDDDKSQAVNTVVIKPLTMGQHRELSKAHKGKDTVLLRACISASTGLSLVELKRLITPDYNSIQDAVLGLMQSTAIELMASDEANLHEPVLLVPFQGDDGQDKTTYKLRPPSVGTTDLMDAHDDEWDRTLFISTSCSGFSRDELARMSLPDWNQLQERLIDFCKNRRTAFAARR